MVQPPRGPGVPDLERAVGPEEEVLQELGEGLLQMRPGGLEEEEGEGGEEKAREQVVAEPVDLRGVVRGEGLLAREAVGGVWAVVAAAICGISGG